MIKTINSFNADFEKISASNAKLPALVHYSDLETIIISYQDLANKIASCYEFYREEGLKQGDIVSAFLPNSIETFVCFLSAIKNGYSYAPYSCNATKREIKNWLNLVKPKLCLTSSLISEEVQAAIKESGIKTVYLNKDHSFGSSKSVEKSNHNNKAKLYLATSGTTGEPKAMILDVDRLWSSACAFTEFHHLPKNQLRFWNYLPMSYLGGLFNLGLVPLSLGGSVVIDETFSGKTILSFWQTIDRLDINALWFSPSIVQGLIGMAERTGQNLTDKYGKLIKAAFVGMAPIKLKTKEKFKEIFGFELLENFALSETTFFTSETNANIVLRKESSVGQVLPYLDLKFSETKEIMVKTPFIFDGYLMANGTIDNSCDEQGYFATKDTGYLTDNGIVIIEGRTRDIIKKGGYFIALREIEILAEQHPAVLEAAAARIEHDFYSESFDLYLLLKSNLEELSVTEVNQYLHENLVKYKWPNRVIVCKSFPKTAGGKVKKHLLGLKTSHE